ncbi:MAG: hypothetical protein KOO62_04515 [candidate division Zixibacteria bacterium]|nr:hypothetical protein [candidate division Zixibacteria bacterium]
MLSCSDDPTGPGEVAIDFPNEIGWHWKYELNRVKEFDTTIVDVNIVLDTTGANGKPATMWVLDYHGVLDTIVYQIGDSVYTFIGILPPNDTCLVSINGDSVVIVNRGFFDFERIIYKYPFEIPMQWRWTDSWGRTDHVSEVISVGPVEVGEKAFPNAVRIESIFYPSMIINWSYIRTSVWLVPDVGMVQAIENKIKYDNATQTESYVEINVWKLMEYKAPD